MSQLQSRCKAENSSETCGVEIPYPRAPIVDSCPDNWGWDTLARSPEVKLHGERWERAQFHPNWSNGTAGVRGSRGLSRSGRYYWEIHLNQRIFGTSMMFGVCSQKSRLHADAFVNILGEDAMSWGLSHKGLLWHAGHWRQYTRPFKENEPTTVGLLYDGYKGTLSYFKDGVYLGIAFRGLNKSTEELYPAVSSTAAKTEMTLGRRLRSFTSLQDRCRAVVALYCENNDIDDLPLPTKIKEYIKELAG